MRGCHSLHETNRRREAVLGNKARLQCRASKYILEQNGEDLVLIEQNFRVYKGLPPLSLEMDIKHINTQFLFRAMFEEKYNLRHMPDMLSRMISYGSLVADMPISEQNDEIVADYQKYTGLNIYPRLLRSNESLLRCKSCMRRATLQQLILKDSTKSSGTSC